ncbi:DinB family protein [Variovorax paradoxus]|nr:DinB family protein [Variovorax paradoxus]
MTATRNARMLMRYSARANSRLFEAISKLPDGVVLATRPDGVGSMLSTLTHSHVVDLIWQAHLLGKAHGFTTRNTDVLPSLDQLRSAQERIDAWYVRYADECSSDLLDEVVHFAFVDGGRGEMSRGDILLHVANHKTYHRGYVAEMLYRVSSPPPTMDLPVFVRDVWSARTSDA